MSPPDWLHGDALAVWEATWEVVGAMGLVTAADVEAFATYCEAVVQRRRCAQLMLNSPPLLRGANGQFVANPVERQWRAASMVVARLAAEFGLTPAARQAWRGPASTDATDARLAGLLSG